MNANSSTTATHTPGPWRVALNGIADNCTHRDILSANEDEHDRKLAVVYSRYRSIGNVELEGNARLIAAAPELLAECEADAAWIENLLCDINAGRVLRPQRIAEGLTSRLEKLRACIAKVEGTK